MLSASMLQTIDPPGATAHVRAAKPHEAFAVRLLLPELTISGIDYRSYVATAGANGVIVGAGGVAVDTRHRLAGRCPAEVQVISPWKDRGVEATVWKSLLDDAKTRSSGIICQKWCDNEADAPPVSLGFGVVERKYEFLASIEGSLQSLGPIIDRLRRHHRLPADARAIHFREADPAAVAPLFLKHFPGSLDQFIASLQPDAPEQFDLDVSTVAMHGNTVTGFLLGRVLKSESIFDVYWKAVDERYRNGWSNALCMYASAVRLREIGIQWTRFRALSPNRDTQQLIDHFGGRLAKVEMRYGTASTRVHK
jgi:hypothetical protein